MILALIYFLFLIKNFDKNATYRLRLAGQLRKKQIEIASERPCYVVEFFTKKLPFFIVITIFNLFSKMCYKRYKCVPLPTGNLGQRGRISDIEYFMYDSLRSDNVNIAL